ncbi:hypothetical protein TNCV_742721 [Trichonephila clavipes]|nr:hypothetical protein TNCV_742721 [Trichonephila clavipes]
MDADLGTFLVFPALVEMPDIECSLDVELENTLVSQQLCQLSHVPPSSSLLSSACGSFSLSPATFIARALLELWERLDLRFRGIILSWCFFYTSKKNQYVTFNYFF